MNPFKYAFAFMALSASISNAHAGQIFLENFENYTGGIFDGGQIGDNLTVAYNGNIAGWTKAGFHGVHVVDTKNVFPAATLPRDFAVMLYDGNTLTLNSRITGSNILGQNYSVDFLASPAVYQSISQATMANDGLIIDVLRNDGTMLASYTYLPGAWTGNTVLAAAQFQYVGDGTGDITLEIETSNPGNGRFGGAIDNLSITSIPEPGTLALCAGSLAGLGLFRRGSARAEVAV